MKKKAFWIITLITICIASAMPFSLLAEEENPHIDGFDYFNYYQLEYINPNNGYINTGLKYSEIVNLTIDYEYVYSSWRSLFGATDNNNRLYFEHPSANGSSGTIYYQISGVFNNKSLSNLPKRNSVTYKNNSIQTMSYSYEFNVSNINIPVYLFAVNNNGSASLHGKHNIYSFILNDKLYIPAQNIKSQEVGFYCVSDGTFHLSSGQPFTAGPIVSYNVFYGINVNLKDISSSYTINSINIPKTTIDDSSRTTYNLNYEVPDYNISNTQAITFDQFSSGYRIANNSLKLSMVDPDTDNKHPIAGNTVTDGQITIPNTTLNVTGNNETNLLYEVEIVFDRSYLGSFVATYEDRYGSIINKTIYINGVKTSFTVLNKNPDVTLSDFHFVPNSDATTLNVPSMESNTNGDITNDSFNQTAGQFDSLESGQLDQVQSDLNGINTNFAFGSNSKFLRSANFVKQQFDTNFSNNEFGSVLLFSLTVGLVMLLIGKVLK